MPKQLNAPQITAALQRVFGFKGSYRPMLDEVVVPVYLISDPAPAATQQLAQCSIISNGIPVTAAPMTQFVNPEGSGILAVVTSVALGIRKQAGGQDATHVFEGFFFRGDGATGPSTPKRGIFRDQRAAFDAPTTPRALCTLHGGTTTTPRAADSVIVGVLVKENDATRELAIAANAQTRQGTFTIQPGRSFQIGPLVPADTQDIDLIMNVSWIEVAIDQAPAAGSPP